MDNRLLDMLKMVMQFGSDAWQTPSQQAILRQLLRGAGYLEFEIDGLFVWLQELGDSPDYGLLVQSLLRMEVPELTSSKPDVQLSQGAFQFLTLMKDMGLLDSTMEERMLNQLMVMNTGVIDFDRLRQAVAEVIFERQFRAGEDYFGIFEEEWKLLFA